jgi:hypothetical protein
VHLKRRKFVGLAGAAFATTLLPSLPVLAAYDCSCGLVRYEWSGTHYAASHILVNGQRQRFSYQLYCWHKHLHRKSRMGALVEIAKHRPLTDVEKAELQRCFVLLARQDLRVMRSEGLLNSANGANTHGPK